MVSILSKAIAFANNAISWANKISLGNTARRQLIELKNYTSIPSEKLPSSQTTARATLDKFEASTFINKVIDILAPFQTQLDSQGNLELATIKVLQQEIALHTMPQLEKMISHGTSEQKQEAIKAASYLICSGVKPAKTMNLPHLYTMLNEYNKFIDSLEDYLKAPQKNKLLTAADNLHKFIPVTANLRDNFIKTITSDNPQSSLTKKILTDLKASKDFSHLSKHKYKAFACCIAAIVIASVFLPLASKAAISLIVTAFMAGMATICSGGTLALPAVIISCSKLAISTALMSPFAASVVGTFYSFNALHKNSAYKKTKSQKVKAKFDLAAGVQDLVNQAAKEEKQTSSDTVQSTVQNKGYSSKQIEIFLQESLSSTDPSIENGMNISQIATSANSLLLPQTSITKNLSCGI
ncbi:hypothetical protein [Rickettsiales endosymbiont of Stachyamoeba lipophora]|uniref:hypothetical protein n=1 Tax=Rickettsiales endosymbiont of Stachyamoeba lipophora TaxID=2486578 RepID=UPI000F64D52C|nr:hypothetical protein [Rickettsiales endosymbiont of Stachyamoeba lipophora]AZL15467.1 hypothetical protein EF513_02720 [Rickettsiales endosymbiont of Stachyamoeba lipophora]